MGDAAIQQVIDALADQPPWMSGGVPSVRIEHATLLSREQIDRMNRAAMRFGGTTQIIFMYAEHESYSGNLSAAQFGGAYPLRTFYDHFEHMCLSSDAPSTTWNDPDNVFDSIQAAVTRRAYNGADINREQALTVAQAVLMHTTRAGMVAPYEGPLGRIAEGYEASFVVLDRDLFSIPPESIQQARVVQTWIRGQLVYER
jgi:predicted amidohydrolase YtcJ